MTEDEYLRTILVRESVNTGLLSPVRAVQYTLAPVIQKWAGQMLLSISPTGSFVKGTANKSGTDIDLFLSLSHHCTDTLEHIYETLVNALAISGYTPRQQNVSVNVRINGFDVDLVPAKRQDALSQDHSIWRRKAKTWTKTNFAKHNTYVINGGRIPETRIIKLWRDQKSLDFPSFYLELSVIEALRGRLSAFSARNVMAVFHYLHDTFPTARIVDPANTNNIVSDDLTTTERAAIRAAANRAIGSTNWNQIVL